MLLAGKARRMGRKAEKRPHARHDEAEDTAPDTLIVPPIPDEKGVDNELSVGYNIDNEIIFRGDESPQERARRILEFHKPETRPILTECLSCRFACKQRRATDAVILFTCVDRREL